MFHNLNTIQSLLIQRPKARRAVLTTVVLLVTCLVVSWQNLQFYLLYDFNVLLALLVAPFVLYLREPGVYSSRYGWLALGFLAGYFFLKIQVCFYLGAMSFLLLVVESRHGKLNNLPLFVAALVSPFTRFVSQVLGVPIRLELTQLAAKMLQPIYPGIEAKGNVLHLGEATFSVDPACMGLNLLITGLLGTLVVIAYHEKKRKCALPFWMACVLAVLAFVLIILSNLLRIVGIVIFDAPPETALHDFLGLFNLAVYVWLPMLVLVPLVFKGLDRLLPTKDDATLPSKPIYRQRWPKLWRGVTGTLMVLILASLTYFNANREDYRNNMVADSLQPMEMAGFQVTVTKGGVCKMLNGKALIYIKPSVGVYGADHSPLICWPGSGYSLKNEREAVLAGHTVYTAELSNADGSLYTAWWYDNGQHQTTSQLDWRWRMMLGEAAFQLVNVSCESEAELQRQVGRLMGRQLFVQN